MTEPEPAAPAERDGFAVASLITGVLGFFGITAVLGLGFGIVALVRIRRTGGRGRGLAIGGIAAGAAWMIALPVAAALLLGSLLSASNAPIAALKVDDCYDTARLGRDAVRVPCAGAHDGVVLDAFTMADPETSYPGDREARASALSRCEERLSGMFGGAGAGPMPAELVYNGYAPDETAWAAGNRIAVCGVQLRSGELVGPWRR
jgi:hypothetical protein